MNMSTLWSEKYKRVLWRQIWVALAKAQLYAKIPGVTEEMVKDLIVHQNDVDVEAALLIEATTKHDLMAEIQLYASQCKIGGGIIHLGATSADIEENADALRLSMSLKLIRNDLSNLINSYSTGFRFRQEGENFTPFIIPLVNDKYDVLSRAIDSIRGKGLKGAVGTSASYVQLLSGTGISAISLELKFMEFVGILPFTVTTQVAPRKQEFMALSSLINFSITLIHLSEHLHMNMGMEYKIHLRVLQNQNMVAHLTGMAWDNASHSLLERTLDDSANRRYMLPTAFIKTTESLQLISNFVEEKNE